MLMRVFYCIVFGYFMMILYTSQVPLTRCEGVRHVLGLLGVVRLFHFKSVAFVGSRNNGLHLECTRKA